jgi:hypothetical protein
MFDKAASPAASAPTVRVPFAALASRPNGIAVAADVVDLADAIGRARAGEPTREHDPETETEAELVDAISCWERAKSAADARQIRAIAALARRPMFAGCAEHGAGDADHGIRTAASIVSAELRISPGHARTRVELACELVEHLPDTLAALAPGASTCTAPGCSSKRRDRSPPTRGCAPTSRATCWSKRVAKPGRSYGPVPVAQSWLPIRRQPKSGTPGPALDAESSPPFRNRTDGLLPDPHGSRGPRRILGRHRLRRPAREGAQPRRPPNS